MSRSECLASSINRPNKFWIVLTDTEPILRRSETEVGIQKTEMYRTLRKASKAGRRYRPRPTVIGPISSDGQ